jgi:hypothetical protein
MGHYDEYRPGYSEPGYIEKPKQLQSLDEQIKILKEDLAVLEKLKEESAWPKPYAFYLRGNIEDNLLEDGRGLKLSEKAIERFITTGYEIEFEGTVSKEGVFTCTFIDGVQLARPIDF